jgi:hypothetical protein
MNSTATLSPVYSPPESPYPDTWIVEDQRSDADLLPRFPETDNSSATRVGTSRGIFHSYMLPVVVAAMLNGPARLLSVRRSYQPRSDTVMIDMAWHLDEEYWEPVPQLITNEQVRALNALLATPYTNSHDFEYFADE